mmetsp:Transcript_17865/g.39182  ORF Transcript_17865/g.39182 Transcript_17865/m.39182 type:complete len:243 (+) Transcript_17865:59-787(+)
MDDASRAAPNPAAREMLPGSEQLVKALTHGTEVALDTAIAQLVKEISLRVGPGSEKEQKAVRVCDELLQRLKAKGRDRAGRFSRLALDHLLCVSRPSLGGVLRPSDLIAPVRSLQASGESTELTGRSSFVAMMDETGTCEHPMETDQEERSEVMRASADFATAVQKARALHNEAEQLQRALKMAKACEAALQSGAAPMSDGLDQGAVVLAEELREIAGGVALISQDMAVCSPRLPAKRAHEW